MSLIMTAEGWKQLEPPNCIPASNVDGRYRGPWVVMGNHLVTPGFKLSCEVIKAYCEGSMAKDDYINHPCWKI